MQTEPEKAIIYCRVSSPKQVKQGDGLRSQETRCREYASYRGYEVIGVYFDDITGGAVSRDGMDALLKFLKVNRKKGYITIIDAIDRFARDVPGHWALRNLLREAGGKIESPSFEFGDDADSVLRENLMASVAQHGRQKNAEQTINRMRARAMNGYCVTRAPIDYRYQRVEGHGKLLVRDEPLASIVTQALEGFASGRFETVTEVKRFLESQPAYPRNTNNEVHIERVNEIISRPVYAGHLTYQDWGLNLVPAKHEPLISLATWQAVQDRRFGRMAMAPARRDLSDEFPLRGFVSCGCCGEPLTACWSKGRSARYPYYLCDTRGCSATRKSIRKEVIEREFETLLSSLRPSEGLFNLAFHMFRDLWEAKLASARTQGASLQQELHAVEKRLSNCSTASLTRAAHLSSQPMSAGSRSWKRRRRSCVIGWRTAASR